MKIIKPLSVMPAVLFLASASSASIASSFEGASIEVYGAHQSFTGKPSGFSVNGVQVPANILSFEDVDSSDTVFGGAVNYNIKLSDKFFVGVGFEFDLTKADLGRSNATLVGNVIDAGKHTLKDQVAYLVSPSWLLSDNTLGSLRFGYTTSKLEIGDFPGSPADKLDVDGYVIGLGLENQLTDNVFVKGTFDWAVLNDSDYSGVDGTDTYGYTIEPSGSKLRLGVGYRF